MIAAGSSHYTPGLGLPALPVAAVAAGQGVSVNLIDGGLFRVVGETARQVSPGVDVPLGPRKVRLHDQPSGRLLAEVWSDPVTGAYTFNNVRQGLYYITSFDQTGEFNGVIQTDVTAEPMP